jgi:hypothetical protein
MVDLLTGKAAKDTMKAQAEAQAGQQRQSLARMAFEQGELDQREAANGFRRGKGKQMLVYLGGSGQSSVG